MRARMTRVVSALAGVLFLASGSRSLAVMIDILEYTRLVPGATWTYLRTNFNDDTHEWTQRIDVLDGVYNVNGFACVRDHHYWVNHVWEDWNYYLADFSSGLYLVGTHGRDEYGQAIPPINLCNPPMPILLADFVYGQDYTGQAFFFGEPVTVTLTITEETVAVPAGNYERCLKSVVNVDFNNGILRTTSWYARGIGLIRKYAAEIEGTEETNNLIELQTYSVPPFTGSRWDTGYQDLGGGWRRLGWFGDYVPMGGDGWIWHHRHGFWFVAGDATPASIWVYAMDMGWMWTGHAAYPFLYRHNDGAWLWYNGAVNPRWFMNMATGQWESRP